MLSIDAQTSLWVVGILCLLIGLALGWILTYALTVRNGRTHQLQVELHQLKDHFRDYRDQVTHHFMRTSELVQEMTQSYRAVYEHLASGAQRLCGDLDHEALEATPANRLDNPPLNADEDGVEYDEYAELSRIRDDIDELLGEAPRISDLEVSRRSGDNTLPH
jgi:uncharacterized membrane-anchored protein YhcB (DUF1043 family)